MLVYRHHNAYGAADSTSLNLSRLSSSTAVGHDVSLQSELIKRECCRATLKSVPDYGNQLIAKNRLIAPLIFRADRRGFNE
jgi:hypothetical protein